MTKLVDGCMEPRIPVCPGFPPKSSSSAATWWWESVNLLGNSPKGGIDVKSVLERSATSQGVRVVSLHKSVICVCRPIIFDEKYNNERL